MLRVRLQTVTGHTTSGGAEKVKVGAGVVSGVNASELVEYGGLVAMILAALAVAVGAAIQVL